MYNLSLNPIEVDTHLKYLSATFNASKVIKLDIKILLAAPAKTQQRLFFIKNCLLPSIQHRFIFYQLRAKSFNKINFILCKLIRHILHLLHDFRKAAFHAGVADGGLGIPSLRFTLPIIARKRPHFKRINPYLFRVDDRNLNTINQVTVTSVPNYIHLVIV